MSNLQIETQKIIECNRKIITKLFQETCKRCGGIVHPQIPCFCKWKESRND